jgi:predicted Zn-dependent protease
MRAVVLLCSLLVACTSGVARLAPSEVLDIPWRDDAIGRSLVAARQLSERGEPKAALTEVDKILAADPDNVDAQRLRQDIERGRGRTGLLRAEVERRLRRNPDDAIAHYLRGRLYSDDGKRAREFRRAAKLAPKSFWPWLGLAYALRNSEPDESLAIYARLYRATDHHPVVAVAYALGLRQAGRYEEALHVYEDLRGSSDVPGVGDLGMAQTLLGMGAERRRESWTAMFAALRARPFDPGIQQLVRDWLRAGVPDEQVE